LSAFEAFVEEWELASIWPANPLRRRGGVALRHKETRCTRADASRKERTEMMANKTAGKGTEGSRRERVNRSLDHVIGVRIPDTQPVQPYR
jgi:hypothetical protein